MDSSVIDHLSEALNDCFYYDTLSLYEVKKKIEKIFENKELGLVFQEFEKYITCINGKEKSRDALIFIIALVVLNLDDVNKIKVKIEENNLVSMVYGGLIALLKNKTSKFSLNTKFKNEKAGNQYLYIKNIGKIGPKYSPIIKLIELLWEMDKKKFEELVWADKTYFSLVTIAKECLEIDISKDLALCILNGKDEFKKTWCYTLNPLQL
ncbi:MAG: hypothetical protein L0L86_10450 [Lactococcus lactis]|nr:hypothetical protein [Lactococcus lactis]